MSIRKLSNGTAVSYDRQKLSFDLGDTKMEPEDVYVMMAQYCLDSMTSTMQYWQPREIVKFYHKHFLS